MPSPRPFQDHFSAGSSDYAAFRPRYPETLFRWVASQSPGRDLAWDCATGNGQAAVGLAPLYTRVVATDASSAQLAMAEPRANIDYRCASAEASGLADLSVDVVTVAQALHWFDRPAFFAEVIRVAKPGALLAVWTYNLIRGGGALDHVVDRLYGDVLGRYWPADRALVETGYRDVAIPFAELTTPPFEMSAQWTLAQLKGYLRTWSSAVRYQAQHGVDPLLSVADELAAAWGDPSQVRDLRWPLAVRAARVER
ncbi:MAG: methyltransferase domain-containing protein [Gemmatimonadales bacterium]|nr:methyltransferase domain-containing protein [Gemmatimonadales bacterium]